MIAVLMLACSGSEAPAVETPPPAPPVVAPVEKPPAAPVVSAAAWVGDWVMGDKILATDNAGEVKLMQDGDVVMSGPMEGEGLTRSAPLDGCGADLSLSEVGGDITVALNGPECPVEFAGTYINTVSP